MDAYTPPPIEEVQMIDQSSAYSPKRMDTEHNKLQVLRLFGQVNDGEFATYEDIIDEHVIAYGPASGKITIGRDAIKSVDESYLVAYPDAEIIIKDILAVEDRVAVRWTWKATHLGVYMGIEPTHKEVEIEGMHLYRFNDEGKIIESWANHDRLGEFEQLGVFSLENLN